MATPPADYICYITTQPMKYPVRMGCGHSFDKFALLNWFHFNKCCPRCNYKGDKFLPNAALASKIRKHFGWTDRIYGPSEKTVYVHRCSLCDCPIRFEEEGEVTCHECGATQEAVILMECVACHHSSRKSDLVNGRCGACRVTASATGNFALK